MRTALVAIMGVALLTTPLAGCLGGGRDDPTAMSASHDPDATAADHLERLPTHEVSLRAMNPALAARCGLAQEIGECRQVALAEGEDHDIVTIDPSSLSASRLHLRLSLPTPQDPSPNFGMVLFDGDGQRIPSKGYNTGEPDLFLFTTVPMTSQDGAGPLQAFVWMESRNDLARPSMTEPITLELQPTIVSEAAPEPGPGGDALSPMSSSASPTAALTPTTRSTTDRTSPSTPAPTSPTSPATSPP